jgi:hypothetical protein
MVVTQIEAVSDEFWDSILKILNGCIAITFDAYN